MSTSCQQGHLRKISKLDKKWVELNALSTSCQQGHLRKIAKLNKKFVELNALSVTAHNYARKITRLEVDTVQQ